MSTSRRCPGCGTEVRDDRARWCGTCGAPLGSAPRRDDVPPTPLQEPSGDHEVTGSDRSRWVTAALVVVVLGGLLGAQALRRPPSPTLGYTERGDPARTGRVAADEVAAPGGVAWTVPIDLPLPLTRPALVGLGDEEVVVLGEAGLTVHERTDGTIRWHLSEPRPADGAGWDRTVAPLAVGEVVVVSASLPGAPDTVEVRAYDRSSARQRWTNGFRELTALHAIDGAVLAVDGARLLTLLEPETGRVRWQLDALRRLDMSARAVLAAPDDGPLLVYATSPAGLDPFSQPPDVVGEYVVAIDPVEGQPRWQVDLPRETLSSSPFVIVGDELVGFGPQAFHRWDRRTGAPLGELPHDTYALPPALAATADGDLLVDRMIEATIERYDLEGDGTPTWVVEGRSGRTGQPAVAAGQVVHVPTGDGIEVLSATTGERLGTVGAAGDHVTVSSAHGGQAAAWAGGDVRLVGRDGETVWQAPTPIPSLPAPSVRDGVYVSTGAAVTAVEPDGAIRWTVPMSSDARPARPETAHAVAVADEVVLVVPPVPLDGATRGLVALDPERGVPRWDRAGDSPPATGPLTLAGDLVFMPVDAQIHGYDVSSGRRAFAAVAHASRGPVAVGPLRIVAATSPETTPIDETPGLVAIHRSDRRTAWRRPIGVCAAPLVTGDVVLAVGRTGLRAYAEDTGSPRFAIGLADSGCHAAVAADGIAVVAEDAFTLMGVRVEPGVIRWRTELDAPLAAAPTLAGSTVLVPTLDGAITALDLEAGTERWQVTLDAVPASSVSVVDGAPILLTRDGQLVRLEP